MFALQMTDGRAKVFSQHSGSTVEIGSLLIGDHDGAGFRLFAHSKGFCRALDETGVLDTDDALGVVLIDAGAHRAQTATAATAGAPSPLTQGSHVDRIVFP